LNQTVASEEDVNVNLMYSTVPVWPDDDEEEGSKGTKLFKVSDKTAKFIVNAFPSLLPIVRRQV